MTTDVNTTATLTEEQIGEIIALPAHERRLRMLDLSPADYQAVRRRIIGEEEFAREQRSKERAERRPLEYAQMLRHMRRGMRRIIVDGKVKWVKLPRRVVLTKQKKVHVPISQQPAEVAEKLRAANREAQRRYYQRNKELLLANARERYASDPSLREKRRESTRERTLRKRAQRAEVYLQRAASLGINVPDDHWSKRAIAASPTI